MGFIAFASRGGFALRLGSFLLGLVVSKSGIWGESFAGLAPWRCYWAENEGREQVSNWVKIGFVLAWIGFEWVCLRTAFSGQLPATSF